MLVLIAIITTSAVLVRMPLDATNVTYSLVPPPTKVHFHLDHFGPSYTYDGVIRHTNKGQCALT